MMLWILFIIAEIYRNYYIIEISKSRPNYFQSFVIRGMASILHGIFMLVVDWPSYLILLVFQVGSFWILFDVGLNLLRGKPVLYKGENSGWLDKLPKPIYIILKIIALISAIAVL